MNDAILENFVICELMKSYTNAGREPFMCYYRDRDNKEIDVLIEESGYLHLKKVWYLAAF